MNIYQQILTKYWGYASFRPLQEDIIQSVGNGNDTLGLMPTGGGKSITFQVPALAKEGICIVVTPLIALMRDQVENLKNRKIKAVAIHTGMTKHEIDTALDNCIFGDVKFLYLSPERLGTELFKTRVQKMNVNLIVVDEAHCISQWGYDFRPSYLKIADLRDFFPDVPVLAVTATATPEVVEDIQDKLRFRQKNALRKSFERKNLVYVVRNVEDKLKYLLKILNNVKGCGIVYVRSRKKTKEIAMFLKQNKISADHYHAGLSTETRELKQQEWKTGKNRIMVSTNAFGMGIDKADVRIVVHIDLPDSPEAYFQEAGRAGRDEKRAYAALLFHESDRLKMENRVQKAFPEIPVIKRVYHALGNYFQIPIGGGKGMSFDFNIYDFSTSYQIETLVIYNSLKILEREGYLLLTDDMDNPSRIIFLVNRDDLYKFQVANADMDSFIKLLLRSYTGVFTEYAKIDEQYLASKAGTNAQAVYNMLKKLKNQHIINYIPRKQTPYLVFTEERLDEKSLYISKENYSKRKNTYARRISAIINYVTNSAKCRSRQLLAYFGETDTYRCGLCDVCQKRNELELSKYEFDLILNELKTRLKTHPTLLTDLVDSLKYNEDKILKVIQWLLDNNKIRYSGEDLLEWVVSS